MKNMLTALDFEKSGIETVRVYDNSADANRIRRVLSFRRGQVKWIADEVPSWVQSMFEGTRFEIGRLREI